MLSEKEYLSYDGLGLAELIKNKQVSSAELLNLAINQIEKLNPSIGAVVYKQFNSARETAKKNNLTGPFAGVPFLLKDMSAFESGVPSTFGSYFCKDFKPDFDSNIVKSFKKSGFIIVGRSNAPEFGLYPTTEPKFRGVTRNPNNLDYIAGGSSGGAAAAVASKMVPIAHASDGGGSIRIPASCCGVFGLKPSQGRSPTGPAGGRSWCGFVSEHVLTRSVRDSAAVLDFLSKPIVGAPILAPPKLIEETYLKNLDKPINKLKIAYIEEPFATAKLDQDCREAALHSAKLCENFGHEIILEKLNLNTKDITQAYMIIVAAETTALLDNLKILTNKKIKSGDLEAVTEFCTQSGNAFTAGEYAHAIRIMDEARRSVYEFMEGYDLILTPTLALPPPKIGALAPNNLELAVLKILKYFPVKSLIRAVFNQIPKKGFELAPYTFLFNLTGQPAMSVSLYQTQKDNLPIGTQFVAKLGREDLLFRLAKQLESDFVQ